MQHKFFAKAEKEAKETCHPEDKSAQLRTENGNTVIEVTNLQGSN
jgi:hypothetical protein